MSQYERVFTDEELKDFSKDCMDLALEDIEAGDLEKAKYWCRKEQDTKDLLHDGYVHWVTALLSYIHENLGEKSAVAVIRDELARRASSGLGGQIALM